MRVEVSWECPFSLSGMPAWSTRGTEVLLVTAPVGHVSVAIGQVLTAVSLAAALGHIHLASFGAHARAWTPGEDGAAPPGEKQPSV